MRTQSGKVASYPAWQFGQRVKRLLGSDSESLRKEGIVLLFECEEWIHGGIASICGHHVRKLLGEYLQGQIPSLHLNRCY